MQIIVGVDGGGSNTRASLWRLDQDDAIQVCGEASRCSSVGFKQARDVILDLLRRGLRELGGDFRDVVSVSACLSGIDTEQQAARMRGALERCFPGAVLEVTNDALAALTAGTLNREGIAVIGGTGSIAIGEEPGGRLVRAGGYGNLLGDEGSGFDIGRQGFQAAIQSFEGRGPATMLWQEVERVYGVTHPLELMDRIYGSGNEVARVAQFAESVLACAPVDPVAGRIVAQAAESYVGLIQSVRQQAPLLSYHPIVLAGGLFQHHDALQQELRQRLPDDTFLVLNHAPVVGALIRALLNFFDRTEIPDDGVRINLVARIEQLAIRVVDEGHSEDF